MMFVTMNNDQLVQTMVEICDSTESAELDENQFVVLQSTSRIKP